MVDLLVRDEGTVVVFSPVSKPAREWIDEHVCSEPWQWLGDNLVVDHRYAPVLIAAAAESGLGVVLG